MHKIIAVMMREYRTTVRSKAFLIALFLMPIFMFGSIILQTAMEDRVDTAPRRVAVIDRSGKVYDALQESVKQYNEEIIDPETKRQTGAKFELIKIDPRPDMKEQLLELSEKVRKSEIFAFVDISPDILKGAAPSPNGGPAPSEIKYYSDQPAYRDIIRWLTRSVGWRVQSVRLRDAGLDPEVVNNAMTPVEVENLGLYEKTAGGEIKPATQVNETAAFMLPLGLMLLMWMGLMMTTQPLLHGVLEEKMQRISEVLLGSVPPFQLMLGKLFGYVLVALTLLGLYVAGGYFVADKYGYADLIPVHLIGWFLFFECLAIFMYGAIFLALGSCCNEVKEAQNLIFPAMIPMMLPLFCWSLVIKNPLSTFSTALTLFPPSTPMIVMMRMAVPPGVPTWQIVAGVIGTVIMALVAVWAAGRIFRVGLLMQGKPPRLGQIMKWVISG